MTVDTATVGARYAVYDWHVHEVEYEWAGHRSSAQTTIVKPVTVVAVHERHVLVDVEENFISAPSFWPVSHPAMPRGVYADPVDALREQRSPSLSLSAGSRVWLRLSDLECLWDDVPEELHARRTQPARRADAIKQLREAGWDDQYPDDLGTISVSVGLLLERDEELSVLRQVERAREAAV